MVKSISFVAVCLAALFVGQIQAYDFWNDLRVTWGPTPVGFYNRLPRNIFDAQVDGWEKKSVDCLNGGQFNGFQWIDPKDDGVALLFDANGFVAGIQALVPQSRLLLPGSKVNYAKIPMYQNLTLNGQVYFAITAYFIQPSLICATSDGDSGNIGYQSLVYFQNGYGVNDLKFAPKNRTDAISQGWSKNNCVPAMGNHNFFEVEKYPVHDCSEIQPTFILFNEQDQMHGFGLVFIGAATSPRFERPTSDVIAFILGNAPQCILDQTNLLGMSTLHIYFGNTPWTVGC